MRAPPLTRSIMTICGSSGSWCVTVNMSDFLVLLHIVFLLPLTSGQCSSAWSTQSRCHASWLSHEGRIGVANHIRSNSWIKQTLSGRESWGGFHSPTLVPVMAQVSLMDFRFIYPQFDNWLYVEAKICLSDSLRFDRWILFGARTDCLSLYTVQEEKISQFSRTWTACFVQ